MPKYLVYSLLVAFFVLLSPRGWWHDCDHDGHEVGSTEHVDATCYACDYDMDIATVPLSLHVTVIPPDYYIAKSYACEVVQCETTEITVLRGPPIC